MGMPQGGGMPSPDGSGALAQIESKKQEVSMQIESQRMGAEKKAADSIDTQVKNYEGRRSSISKSLAEMNTRLSQIPDIPQAQEARARIKQQIDQLRQAMNEINKALNYVKQQKNRQIMAIRGQFGQKKKEVISSLNQQKAQVLMQITAQRAMMQDRFAQYMKAQRMSGGEAGKAKG